MNELSIIVACNSRVDILPLFIESLSKYLMSNPGDIEIIIVINENNDSLFSVTIRIFCKVWSAYFDTA